MEVMFDQWDCFAVCFPWTKNYLASVQWEILCLRWFIVAVPLPPAALNYGDQSLLGLRNPAIQKDISGADLGGAMVTSLPLAYISAYPFTGSIINELGARQNVAL